MTIKDSALVVIDVQPAYNKYCKYILPDVVKAINRAKKQVFVYWVGDGLTSDTHYDVRDYFEGAGVTEYALANLTIIEKGFGFLRPWMDHGVADEVIIAGAKLLREKKLNLKALRGHPLQDELEEAMKIYGLGVLYGVTRIPDEFKNLALCGGSRTDCLRELDLWFQSEGRRTTILDSLTYC